MLGCSSSSHPTTTYRLCSGSDFIDFPLILTYGSKPTNQADSCFCFACLRLLNVSAEFAPRNQISQITGRSNEEPFDNPYPSGKGLQGKEVSGQNLVRLSKFLECL